MIENPIGITVSSISCQSSVRSEIKSCPNDYLSQITRWVFKNRKDYSLLHTKVDSFIPQRQAIVQISCVEQSWLQPQGEVMPSCLANNVLFSSSIGTAWGICSKDWKLKQLTWDFILYLKVKFPTNTNQYR